MSASASLSCPFDHLDSSGLGDSHFELYEELCERPISWSDRYGGFWIVARDEEVRSALRAHDTFSSAVGGCFLPDSGFRSLGHESDPPEYRPYRDLYLPLGGRTAVEETTEQLRAMTKRGDAVSRVCERFPVEGISLMAGLSAEKAAWIRELTVEAWKRIPNGSGR